MPNKSTDQLIEKAVKEQRKILSESTTFDEMASRTEVLIREYLHLIASKSAEEEREKIFSRAREQYDEESKKRTNNRKAVVDTDKQENIYIIALRERVVGRLVPQPEENHD